MPSRSVSLSPVQQLSMMFLGADMTRERIDHMKDLFGQLDENDESDVYNLFCISENYNCVGRLVLREHSMKMERMHG